MHNGVKLKSKNKLIKKKELKSLNEYECKDS